MGILDRSKSVTQNVTENRSSPLGVQGDDNVSVISEGDSYIVNTDHNAIDRATELAKRSVDAGESLALEAFSLSRSLTRDVIDVARDSQEIVADQSGDFLQTALDYTRDLNTRFQNTIGSTVDAIQRIGVEQNKSTDQRLAETTERTLRYAVIALGVMAVGLAAFAYSRK